jgi:hypothetical protein
VGGGLYLFCPQSAIVITNAMASTWPADFIAGKKLCGKPTVSVTLISSASSYFYLILISVIHELQTFVVKESTVLLYHIYFSCRL